MDELKKFGQVQKLLADKAAMDKVNAQALTELKAEDVFIFRIRACDDQPDRDHERFTKECLEGLSALYVGKTVIFDHNWSATNQVARIYDAVVEAKDGVHMLILFAYMLRSDQNAPVISAIEGGIMREVSVGCAVAKATCNICGVDKATAFCDHRPGRIYDGTMCVVELSEPKDAFELSFCAVPAQPAAGVTKKYGGEDHAPPADEPPAPADDPEVKKALALLELEEKMFV